MALDFTNAQLPSLTPLAHSFTENEGEKELRDLTLEVFKATLAEKTFDVNVSGARHLGSFDLVRRSVNTDGLVLLSGESEEARTRYLYRAWNAGNVQGRGLHFLRTYLQLLYPGLCDVEQLWQRKDTAYPYGLVSKIDDPATVIDPETMFLTSRLEIALDLSVSTRSITTLTNVIRSIVPARMVPMFRFRIVLDLPFTYGIEWKLFMDKDIQSAYPWCSKVLVEAGEPGWWQLGLDGDPNGPRLCDCIFQMQTGMTKGIDLDYCNVPRLGDPDLYVDGTWQLPDYVPLTAEFFMNRVFSGGDLQVTTGIEREAVLTKAVDMGLASGLRVIAPEEDTANVWRLAEDGDTSGSAYRLPYHEPLTADISITRIPVSSAA